ncbi:MAG: hypothetical protein QG627_24 [Chlamydiota bacterium]|jgi:hypothetical protein|nr:hypothetical protein [Chlamydiota bacterium]
MQFFEKKEDFRIPQINRRMNHASLKLLNNIVRELPKASIVI